MQKPKLTAEGKYTKRKHAITFDTKSKVQQGHEDETDINRIIGRFLGGQDVPGNSAQPMYADISEVPSYHEMQNHIAYADQQFMKLPAKLRGRFNNKSANLVNFLLDDKNKEEATKMGFFNAPEEPTKESEEANSGKTPEGSPKPKEEPQKGSKTD